jgi:hypothetical protein
MRGYSDITRSTSACIHFVDSRHVDQELIDLKRELVASNIRCAYVDARELLIDPENTCDLISVAIDAEHVPYGETGHWVKLLDDMITLSSELPGLVIVIDHADQLFNKDRNKIFELIEAFLVQFHHWLKKSKPCHLCFQMSNHDLVAEVFNSNLNKK